MKLHWISLRNTPILEQLQLEEALLRSHDENFCIVNLGSPKAIVMGISGEPEKLLHISSVQKDAIPVIRRFSGGGTVIVDEHTLFISWIFSKKDTPVTPFPEPLLRWSAQIYQAAWQMPGFALRENDYVIGSRKCGGNAQYIQKDRWLHHTSFLWDYRKENMAYLQMPEKRPSYRLDRDHDEFLCTLSSHTSDSMETLEQKLQEFLVKQFYIEQVNSKELKQKAHRQTVQLISV